MDFVALTLRIYISNDIVMKSMREKNLCRITSLQINKTVFMGIEYYYQLPREGSRLVRERNIRDALDRNDKNWLPLHLRYR